MPKISELPLANKLKEEDYIPIVQDGVTKKVKGTHFVTEEEYHLDAFSPIITANNKAMYKLGEGDDVDFSESAYDGAYKSAILKGQTLVNYYKITDTPFTYQRGLSPVSKLTVNLSANKTYLILLDFSTVDMDGREDIRFYPASVFIDGERKQESNFTIHKNGRFTYKYTPSKDVTYYEIIIGLNNFESNNPTVVLESAMIIEYQEGMEDWDIPYFEGMTSVKMPVLKTTGKNLFDVKDKVRSGEYFYQSPYIYVPVDKGVIDSVNTTTISVEGTNAIGLYCLLTVKPYYSNTFEHIVLNAYGEFSYSKHITPQSFIHDEAVEQQYYLSFCFANGIETDVKDYLLSSDINIQIEYGSIATSYEPYKSNILSTPSDLELCGIGDVKDTLDVNSGEVVERIVEVIFDGSDDEAWHFAEMKGNNYRFGINLAKHGKGVADTTPMICDVLKVGNISSEDMQEQISTYNHGTHFEVRLALSQATISSNNVDELRRFLQAKPIRVKYQLAEQVHKTVDLSGTPFGYKGGHIIKSSAEGSLLPKFEYEVAVSRGAQISQNTSTLIKHDEKITELLKKTAATYINQKAEIAHLLNMSNTLEEAQTIPFIEDDYVNDDCMVDSDMVMDDMELEPEKEIIDNVDTLLINLIYDLIELNDTLDLLEKVELFRQSGLIDKHNYEIIKEKLNPSFKEEDYADINQ